MNGTNDGHGANGTTNERLDQLLSLRQDGALDARESAELEGLLSEGSATSGAAGDDARARARAFVEVDESLRRLAARAIPPARLARGLEAIERRVGVERAGAAGRSPVRTRSSSGLGRFGLGLGLAAAAALLFALLVTTRRDVDETPSLAQSDAAEGSIGAATTAAKTDAMTDAPSAAATELAIDATAEGADGTLDRGEERVDDSTGLPASPPQVAEAESDLDEHAGSVAVADGAAEELASLGIEEASDLEVIEELELLDFLATRNPAPEGPRG